MLSRIKSFLNRFVVTRPAEEKRPEASSISKSQEPHSDPESAQSDATVALDPEQDFIACLFVSQHETDQLHREEKEFISQLETLLLSDEVGGLVPRMSGSLPKLLASLRGSSSVKELGSLVVADPELLANILKVVNSPFYMLRAKKIENVNQALVILGEKGLREVIASVVLRPIMTIKAVKGVDPSLVSSLWDEALKCAVTCRSLAQKRGSTDPFAVYLSGLTSSVGLTATLRQMAVTDQSPSHPFSSTFLVSIRELNRKLSYHIVKSWGFPEKSQEILQAFAYENGTSETAFDLGILQDSIRLAYTHTLSELGIYDESEVELVVRSEAMKKVWRTEYDRIERMG